VGPKLRSWERSLGLVPSCDEAHAGHAKEDCTKGSHTLSELLPISRSANPEEHSNVSSWRPYLGPECERSVVAAIAAPRPETSHLVRRLITSSALNCTDLVARVNLWISTHFLRCPGQACETNGSGQEQPRCALVEIYSALRLRTASRFSAMRTDWPRHSAIRCL
jgi:hypothetical protein